MQHKATTLRELRTPLLYSSFPVRPPPISSFSFRRASRSCSKRSRQSVCSSHDAGAWVLARQEKQNVCLQSTRAHTPHTTLASNTRNTLQRQQHMQAIDAPTAADDRTLPRGAPNKGRAVGPGATGKLARVFHKGHDLPQVDRSGASHVHCTSVAASTHRVCAPLACPAAQPLHDQETSETCLRPPAGHSRRQDTEQSDTATTRPQACRCKTPSSLP
jgi:hypothetical protein